MIIENINVKDNNVEEIVKTYKLDQDLLLDVQDSSEIARFLEKSSYTEVILKYPLKTGRFYCKNIAFGEENPWL